MNLLFWCFLPLGDCMEYEFTCRTGSECVKKDQKCDGRLDCSDLSDEFDCGKALIRDSSSLWVHTVPPCFDENQR